MNGKKIYREFETSDHFREPREDTSASFMEDELRYAGERLQAVATQKARLESAIREAITALSLASFPEYSAVRIAGEVSDILAKALVGGSDERD